MADGTNATTNAQRWKEWVESGHSAADLGDLLAEDVVFYSPVVHTPQGGKAITQAYLLAAGEVLMSDKFAYLRTFDCDQRAVLEFEAEIDGLHVNGIDMIEWNAEGKITEFKVMVRPLKAVNAIHAAMGRMLAAMDKSKVS